LKIRAKDLIISYNYLITFLTSLTPNIEGLFFYLMVLAKYISVLLHPFICATISFLLLLSNSYLSFSKFLIIAGITFSATVIIPTIQVLIMKSRGRTISMDIPEREKRIVPFFTSVLIYSIALIALWIIRSPKPVLILMWAYVFNTIVATIITKYWKISIHGMALGGPIAALGLAVSPLYLWCIFLIFPMTYSRVKLNAHTTAQVMAGFILGFLLTATHFILLGTL